MSQSADPPVATREKNSARPLRNCELAHWLSHDDRVTRYALHPIGLTRPRTGSARDQLRCGNCGRSLWATVDSRLVWWPRRTKAMLTGTGLILLGLLPILALAGLLAFGITHKDAAAVIGCPVMILLLSGGFILQACWSRGGEALRGWRSDHGVRLDDTYRHEIRRRGSDRQRHPKPWTGSSNTDWNLSF